MVGRSRIFEENIVEKEPTDALKEVKVKNNLRPDSGKTMLTRCVETSMNLKIDKDTSVWRLQPERFSSWERLIRTQAWVMRFISNCRINENERLLDQELNSEEISDVESHIVRTMQKGVFSEEYRALIRKDKLPRHSKLLKLCLQLDDDGIMRADGRLKYAEFFPYNTRYPIILPRKSWVTKLIIKHHHELGGHSTGTNQTLSFLSSKYWILAAREAIIEWERECGMCKRRTAKNAIQMLLQDLQ